MKRSARKAAEDARRKSEEQCPLLLESAAEGIYSVDLNGNCTFANHACLRLLAYESLDELLGRSMHALSHHTKAEGTPYPRVECPIFRALQQGAEVHADDEFLCREGGTRFPVEYWSHPLRDSGKVIGAVVTFLDITKRKEAEKALRESEEKFREFAESAHEVFWMVDAASAQVLYVSPAYEEVWGRRCEDLYREPFSWREAVHPEDAERVLRLRRKQLQGEQVDDEYKIVRPDGSVRWVRDRSFPIRDKAGQIKRIAGIAKDVTEWKQTGAALRKSEERYRSLFENNMAGVLSSTRDGRIIDCNDSIVRMLGYASREELMKLTMRDIYLAEADRDAVLGQLEEEKSLRSRELCVRRKDASPLWILLNLNVVQGEGEPDAVFLGTAIDISERKRAEDALRRSEEHFRLLFKVIPHPVWVYDLKTLRFLEVNDAAVSLYGYSHSEFCQMTISDIEAPREGTGSQDCLADFRGSIRSTGHRQHRTKSGRVVDVEIDSHTLEFGGQKAVLVVGQDTTERKRHEIDLRHAQKLEAVGGLASGIAHELNTPIQFVGDNIHFLQEGFAAFQRLLSKHRALYQAALSGPIPPSLIDGVRQAEEVEEADYLSEEVPKTFTQTLDGVNRVATIVRAMRDFAHPSQGQKTAADLNKALASTLIVARNEIKYVADVKTEFGNLQSVLCNLEDLNQVFLNLLVNAAHAIGEAAQGTGRRGVIQVRTWRDEDRAMIAISDTGCGIPENIRHRIFDPFFTTKAVGQGTGQGLAISRSIVVEKHGGTLSFESRVGRGTTFYVSLPIQGAPVGEATVSNDKNTLR